MISSIINFNIIPIPQFIELDNAIKVLVRQNIRAKRVILKIKQGNPELVIPFNYKNFNYALNFLKTKQQWLKVQLNQRKFINFTEGEVIKILGKEYRIRSSPMKRQGIEFEGNEILIYGNMIAAEERIKRFLIKILFDKIIPIANHMALKINCKYSRITIKLLSSKLGSCSSKRELVFCLRLLFMEEFVLEYVIAHEIAHLKEMNHSKNFWAIVNVLYPNWGGAKKWLNQHGQVIL